MGSYTTVLLGYELPQHQRSPNYGLKGNSQLNMDYQARDPAIAANLQKIQVSVCPEKGQLHGGRARSSRITSL